MLEKPFGAGEGAVRVTSEEEWKNLRLRVCPLGLPVELSDRRELSTGSPCFSDIAGAF